MSRGINWRTPDGMCPRSAGCLVASPHVLINTLTRSKAAYDCMCLLPTIGIHDNACELRLQF